MLLRVPRAWADRWADDFFVLFASDVVLPAWADLRVAEKPMCAGHVVFYPSNSGAGPVRGPISQLKTAYNTKGLSVGPVSESALGPIRLLCLRRPP